MNPAAPTGESQKRLDFLYPTLYILPGHWGGYYHVATHPYLSLVQFNDAGTKAIAFFKIGYMFGEAEFKKTGSQWKMIRSEMTGIE